MSDVVVEKKESRALHKTTSIFLRNLAPSITKAEVEAVSYLSVISMPKFLLQTTNLIIYLCKLSLKVTKPYFNKSIVK